MCSDIRIAHDDRYRGNAPQKCHRQCKNVEFLRHLKKSGWLVPFQPRVVEKKTGCKDGGSIYIYIYIYRMSSEGERKSCLSFNLFLV